MTFLEKVNEEWQNKRLKMLYDFDPGLRERLLAIKIKDVDETIHEDEYSDEGFWSQYELIFEEPDGNEYIVGVEESWGKYSNRYEICNASEDKYFEGESLAKFFGTDDQQTEKLQKLFDEFNIVEMAKRNIEYQLQQGKDSKRLHIGQTIVDVYEKDRKYHFVLKDGSEIIEPSHLARE